MGIDSLKFLQVTNPTYGNVGEYNKVEPKFYEQNSNQNYGLKKLSNEDYEKALAYLNGDLKVGKNENPFNTQGVKSASNVKGKAFENFKVPPTNGTGELIPDVSNREDSIEGCPWEAYLA